MHRADQIISFRNSCFSPSVNYFLEHSVTVATMGFYLLIVILVGMLIIWKCKSMQSQIPSRKRKLKHSERLLVVTAHPDDECMFFGPLITTAVRKWCLDDVFILCCSTGDHYGEGIVRIQELSTACEVLGVHRDNIQCISDPLLPDSPLSDWNHARLKVVINGAISKWNPSVIVTFDEKGVSGHRNHCDLARCLITMQQSGVTSMKGRRLLLLDTVNPVRKYMRYVDIPFTLFGDFDLLTVASREHTQKIEGVIPDLIVVLMEIFEFKAECSSQPYADIFWK